MGELQERIEFLERALKSILEEAPTSTLSYAFRVNEIAENALMGLSYE